MSDPSPTEYYYATDALLAAIQAVESGALPEAVTWREGGMYRMEQTAPAHVLAGEFHERVYPDRVETWNHLVRGKLYMSESLQAVKERTLRVAVLGRRLL